ncbi:MAG: SulP family inorganic anion transporter [Acidimicrobiales bacterium]
MPKLNRLRPPDRRALVREVGAGMVLSVFLIPVGMAYAQASGLPPITGLYASAAPMLAYGLIGPSRIMVLGPDSSLAPLILATVVPLSAGDADRAVVIAAAMAIGTGLLSLAAGLGGLGLLTELLSMPVRYGYLLGVAVVVTIGQLPTLFGIEADGDTVVRAVEVGRALLAGRGDLTTAAVGLVSLLALVVLRRVWSDMAAVAVTVGVAIVATRVVGVPDNLEVIGPLPRGVPIPSFPTIGRADLGSVAIGAVGIALVSFADTSVLSQSYAARNQGRVDPNRELVALGLANLTCGFFQGFPVSGSSSRTPVLESAGARSQLAGLVAAGALLLVVAVAPNTLATLPLATLVAVLLVAVSNLVQWRTAQRLLADWPLEFVMSMVCAVGVVVAGPLWGIGLAVAISLLLFLQRAWRPHTTTLVRVDGMKGYHDADRHPEGRQIPKVLLYRFDAPLFFANAEVFRRDLMDRVAAAGPNLTTVVIAAEPVTGVDATADLAIRAARDELAEQGIELGFAELKGVVRDRLERSGTVELLGADRFHPTVGRAVHDHVRRQGVDWVDWEDA